MRVFSALFIAAALQATAVARLHAQRSGIMGTISDTLGNVLGGVQVELSGTDYGSISNMRGEFRLLKVKPGPYTIFMRRLGFEALSMKLEVKDGNPMELDFELSPTTVRLATISVKEPYLSEKLKRVGFEGRLKMSGIPPSHFITRADIEQRNESSLTHLIERQGGRVRNCVDAIVWIDGIPPAVGPDPPTAGAAGGGALGRNSSIRSAARSENSNTMRYRPLESIPVKTVDGMEIFASISEVPVEFRAGGNTTVNGKCVILIWTREGNR